MKSDAPTKDVWKALRKAFDPKVIGKLPKPTKASNEKGKCNECGKWHGLPAVHLDYVGHAAVTDRLNSVVGPENWDLTPMAVDDHGNPMTNAKGELWCWLRIFDAKKMCVGDGSTSSKELIGDALRNGAMRFGIALDLWSKEELESHLDEPEMKNEKPSADPKVIPGLKVKELKERLEAAGIVGDEVANFCNMTIDKPKPEDEADVDDLIAALIEGESEATNGN